jgi:hypothetical protein
VVDVDRAGHEGEHEDDGDHRASHAETTAAPQVGTPRLGSGHEIRGDGERDGIVESFEQVVHQGAPSLGAKREEAVARRAPREMAARRRGFMRGLL